MLAFAVHDAFAASLEVYRAAGRRSLSPAMAMGAALAYLVAEARDEADAMLAVVASYKAMEAEVARMSGAAGVEWTVIRAGTLKGGGSGCSGEEGDERSVGRMSG